MVLMSNVIFNMINIKIDNIKIFDCLLNIYYTMSEQNGSSNKNDKKKITIKLTKKNNKNDQENENIQRHKKICEFDQELIDKIFKENPDLLSFKYSKEELNKLYQSL
jgi:hypothetical protein